MGTLLTKAARNHRLAQVGGTRFGRARAGAGSWRDFFSEAIHLAGVSWRRWGLKEKRQVGDRRSGGHHIGDRAAVSELTQRPPSPASRAPTGAHSSTSIPCTSCPHWSSSIPIPCTSAQLQVLDKLCSLPHLSLLSAMIICASLPHLICAYVPVLQFVFDYLCTGA
jgi:hypothetical protein